MKRYGDTTKTWKFKICGLTQLTSEYISTHKKFLKYARKFDQNTPNVHFLNSVSSNLEFQTGFYEYFFLFVTNTKYTLTYIKNHNIYKAN